MPAHMGHAKHKRAKFMIIGGGIMLPIHVGLWMAYTCSPSAAEWIAGSAIALLAAIPALAFASCGRLQFKPNWKMLAEARHIPWNAITGCGQVGMALCSQLFTSSGADNQLAMIPFQTRPRNGRTAAARTLALLYSSITPNFIVLGYDIPGGRMLFHQVRKAPVSPMTRRLGGQPWAK